jgi:hypothetical protein
MKYTVGQVVYVIISKKSQVYPMRVIEVISKKTLEGEATQYLLQAGSDPTSTIMLDKIDGEVYTSAEEVQKTLINRATAQIKKLVDVAAKKSVEWYGPRSSQAALPEEDIQFDISKAESLEQTKVMLPDGTIATVKIPAA